MGFGLCRSALGLTADGMDRGVSPRADPHGSSHSVRRSKQFQIRKVLDYLGYGCTLQSIHETYCNNVRRR